MGFLKQTLKTAKYDGIFIKSPSLPVSKSNVTSRIKATTSGDVTEYRITVKFSDYNNIDDDSDLMVRGCFDKSIAKHAESNRKIAFLWQHALKDPIGRIDRIWDDEDGAYVEVILSDFDAVPNAKRAWTQVAEGVLNQASFGFRYVWDSVKYVSEEESTLGKSYFYVGEVELFEVSIVTAGMNEYTEVLDYQEAQKALIADFLKKDNVKKALLGLNNVEVDTFLQEYGIKREQKRSLFSVIGGV